MQGVQSGGFQGGAGAANPRETQIKGLINREDVATRDVLEEMKGFANESGAEDLREFVVDFFAENGLNSEQQRSRLSMLLKLIDAENGDDTLLRAEATSIPQLPGNQGNLPPEPTFD